MLGDQTMTLERFFGLLDAAPTLALLPSGAGVHLARPLQQGFELHSVSFTYPGSSTQALHRVSLKIPAGKTVALVGENGAGKSTVVKLLTRLYDPTEGEITLEGVPLREYALTSLRRGTSVVCQEFVRYALTARENIAVGNIDRRHDDRNLCRAAVQSGVATTIDRLPHGWEQLLGKEWEGGAELSAGQWQKLALARAFFREDAPILILDEPTAALDAETEHEIFHHFSELAAGRTALLISHRLSTVSIADWIIVMKDGRVIEQGTHAQLRHTGGHYACLYEMQAAPYR
jgi:ATP-binding cassette subfamily B protein